MKSKNVVMTAGGLVLGAVGSNIVSKQAAKMFPAISKYSGIVPIALGWFLAGQKNETVKALGAGMIAAGGASIVGGFLPGDAGMNEDLSEDMNEDLTEVLTEDLSEVLTEDLSENMNEDLTEDLNEDLTEDLSEDLA